MQLLNIDYVTTAADLAIVTTAETVVLSSNVLPMPYVNGQFRIRGYFQLTTGTNTTSVTVRIRRGNTASGTLVNEANTETIVAAAGSTSFFTVEAFEPRQGENGCQYCMTVAQVGASANGSVLQAGIEVVQMN